MRLHLLDKTFFIVMVIWTVVVCGASMAYQEYRDNIYFTAYIEKNYISKTIHESALDGVVAKNYDEGVTDGMEYCQNELGVPKRRLD